jgi:hypothetical protein
MPASDEGVVLGCPICPLGATSDQSWRSGD